MALLPAGVVLRPACRVCGPDGNSPRLVLDLGSLDLVAFPQTPHSLPHPPVPVMVQRCPTCSLVQLRHTTPPDWLYREYWYRSGTNDTMVTELYDVVRDLRERLPRVTARTLVLDIGANDGTLLAGWSDTCEDLKVRPFRIAFEPATTFYQSARRHAEELHAVTFPHGSAQLAGHTGKVSAVTTIAMVYDLDAPHPFVAEIARLLTPEGVWIAQFQDLLTVIQTTGVDYFCHEHLECYSLYSFSQLIRQHGLQVVDVSPRPINGGSLRVVVQRAAVHPKADGLVRVSEQLQCEADAGLLAVDEEAAIRPWVAFSARLRSMQRQVRAVVDQATAEGQIVDLLGASTKGLVLLQLTGLNSQSIRQAWERSGAKHGRFVGGTGIPIVSEARGRSVPPDLVLVPIWQFREAVIAREADYLAHGGALLFPLPAPVEVYRQAAPERKVGVA